MMPLILRRLRGILGLGLIAAITWALIGAALGTIVLIVDPGDVSPGETPPWIAYYFGRAGFVSGMIAAIVLLVAERGRTLLALRWPRIAVWGALGGFALPWLAVAPMAMLPAFVVLGAATITGALAIAKRGERLSLGDAVQTPTLPAGSHLQP
jgi:hypothetical protein